MLASPKKKKKQRQLGCSNLIQYLAQNTDRDLTIAALSKSSTSNSFVDFQTAPGCEIQHKYQVLKYIL